MFDKTKKAYVDAREEQRKKIMDYLESKEFKVAKGNSGKGNKVYTSNGRITPYDLRIWKWIEAWKDGKYYFISLQAFDQDPSSGNYHVLMDRISIFVCDKEELPTKNATKADKQKFNERITSEMGVTSIDLPMNEEKLEQLVNLLNA